MKLTKTAIKKLKARYKSVLLKCALINAVLLIGTGNTDAATIISGGHHQNRHEFLYQPLEINGGSFQNMYYNAPSVTITNGDFHNTYLSSSNSISIFSGNFDGMNTLEAWDTTLSGGHFNGLTKIESGSLTIGDDFSQNSSAAFWIKAFVFDIRQENFVFQNTVLQGLPYIKTVAGTDTFVMSPGDMKLNKWTWNGSEFYVPEMPGGPLVLLATAYAPSSYTSHEVTLINANLTLNDNARINTYGLGAEHSFENGNAKSKFFQIKTPLSAEEIENSINIIWNEIERIDKTSKNVKDAQTPFYELIKNNTLVENAWNYGWELREQDVKMSLRNQFENALEDIKPQDLFIHNSAITMNDLAEMNADNITISGSEIVANGMNTVSADKEINFNGDSKIIVSDNAVLNVHSDIRPFTLKDSTLILAGALNGNMESYNGTVSFDSATAHLNGFLSGNINFRFNTNYKLERLLGLSSATIETIEIADGKTLDIGSETLSASMITGGILEATLTDAAKTSAIITANATNVLLKLDMSAASSENVTLYKITDGYGFTFGEYDTNLYAVSSNFFERNDLGNLDISGWTGGDLYILKLSHTPLTSETAQNAAGKLEENGIALSQNTKIAVEILNNNVKGKLQKQQSAIEHVNTLLQSAISKENLEQIKQLMQESSPERAPSAYETAKTNVSDIFAVVGTRIGKQSFVHTPAKGRAGGDLISESSAVWIQGIYNKTKLSKENGFDSDSTGFAAGIEYNINDSAKIGVGYAYASTNIDTNRSKTSANTHTGFAYGEYKPNAFYINGILSYGLSKYEEKTKLASLKSNYDADIIAGQVLMGYNFGLLTPEAGLRYTNVRQKEYTNALGVKIQSDTTETWTGVLGIKASKEFQSQNIIATPEIKLVITQDLIRDNQNRTIKLANGTSYLIEGDHLNRFGVEAGAGIRFKINKKIKIGAHYESRFKNNYTDHTGMLNFKYSF